MSSTMKRKGNVGKTQRTPNSRRASLAHKHTSDDDDSYIPDEENDHYPDTEDQSQESSEEDRSSSATSSRKVTFNTSKNTTRTFKIPPVVSQRRYIPDFDSLPTGGVWDSPAPSRHTEFRQVVVRTTKCDVCNLKVDVPDGEDGKVMQRCRYCNIQFCQECVLSISKDKRHFPVLAELVWDPQTKVNATTRNGLNINAHMHTKPKPGPRPTRPMTPSERLAASRNIKSNTFGSNVIHTPAPPSRPSRAKVNKASTKKAKKPTLPPGYAPEEVDTHFELDYAWISELPIAEQRKEKKEAAMRHLLRKPSLETTEELPPFDAEPVELQPRTPLPSGKRRKVNPRTATPVSTRRQSRGSAKATVSFELESTQQQHTMAAAPVNSGKATTRDILDELTQNSRVTTKANRRMVERSAYAEEHDASPVDDDHDDQANNDEEEDAEFEPEYD